MSIPYVQHLFTQKLSQPIWHKASASVVVCTNHSLLGCHQALLLGPSISNVQDREKRIGAEHQVLSPSLLPKIKLLTAFLKLPLKFRTVSTSMLRSLLRLKTPVLLWYMLVWVWVLYQGKTNACAGTPAEEPPPASSEFSFQSPLEMNKWEQVQFHFRVVFPNEKATRTESQNASGWKWPSKVI